MKRMFLLVLGLALVCAGTAFGQTDTDETPKNTVTLDIGPVIMGPFLQFTAEGASTGADNTFGFGIAMQYERQILSYLTVAVKLGYLGCGHGFTYSGISLLHNLPMKFDSFTAEGHARFYPGNKNIFFLDGMLGYTNFAITTLRKESSDGHGGTATESISYTASKNYFLYGAKIGWRMDFGTPGGFIFEPSFGWYGFVGFGDTFGKAIANKINAPDQEGRLNDSFKNFENFFFVGGPRLALNFGWRF